MRNRGFRPYTLDPARRRGLSRLLPVLMGLLPAALSAAPQLAPGDLAAMSLEELSNIRVTSVSRRPEALAQAPASIFVITAEEIRRSGAGSLPEALRLAPNLQVARINAFEWAITARGFNNQVGNKLLVLIDGRTAYTPLFSGVFWEMQDTLLEDVERIEVISGPGGTLWGTNAVNGVINVITRHSEDTPGTLVSAEGGAYQRGGALRQGGRLGQHGSWRAWGKYRELDNTYRPDGSAGLDNWRMRQGGFRLDWSGDGRDLSLALDALRGESEHRGVFFGIELPAVEVRQDNLSGRWTEQLDGDASLRVQAYWSRTEREERFLFSPDADILDLDIQHQFSLGDHDMVWGGGYRHARDSIRPGIASAFIPEQRDLDWQHLYLQDDFRVGERLQVTPGLRLEWNDYTGMEYLPSLRLAWQVAEDHLLWSALSRAVRAPARYDRDVYAPGQPPYIVTGGPDFQSEIAHVTEIGWRGQPRYHLNYALTLFHHDWRDLRSGSGTELPITLANHIEGESWGIEGWLNWEAAPNWRLRAGFTTLDKDLRFETGKTDTVGVDNPTLHNDPDYQLMLRSSTDLPGDLQMDLQLRHIDSLEVEPVPAYTELDLWLSWYPRDDLALILSGRNLLDQRHPEYGAPASRNEISRSVTLGIRWTP